MKEAILQYLEHPEQLEKLYRSDEIAFRRAFNELYPEILHSKLAAFWNERLNANRGETAAGSGRDMLFLMVASLLAYFVAKIPELFGIDEEFFYSRNAGFIVFPFLAAYFAWKHRLSAARAGAIGALMLGCVLFMNFLPDNPNADTLTLSCMHLMLVLWALLGYAFTGGLHNATEKRLAYLRYNGDLVVICALLVIAGAILSGMTIGLFSLIGFQIEEFYGRYIAIFGAAAIPLAGTHLTRINPQLVGKISPVIARIFSPLVLVMLVVFLLAMIWSGKDPYNDREFLIIFNVLLIGVLAIILFSVAGTRPASLKHSEIWVLFLLSAVTVIVNSIALSAILFRISEWGFTPNRTAVLGSNILILAHLLLVTAQLFRVFSNKENITGVWRAITAYLPVYLIWASIVTFLFPFVFGFK